MYDEQISECEAVSLLASFWYVSYLEFRQQRTFSVDLMLQLHGQFHNRQIPFQFTVPIAPCHIATYRLLTETGAQEQKTQIDFAIGFSKYMAYIFTKVPMPRAELTKLRAN